MALSQKHRTTLFTKLAPMVGEEETEAMLAEFPSTDLDVPATKDFVRAELHHEIGQLRTEIAAVQTNTDRGLAKLQRSLAQVEARIGQLEVRMVERMRGQMIWLTGLVVAALGLLRAFGG